MKEKSSENPCEAKTYINFPPISNLWTSCLPCEDFVDQLVTFSASDSNDPDGEVVKANFEISNKAGNTVAAFEDLEKPFIWENIFEKPGLYTITAFVTDDFGAMSQRSSIELGVTQRRLFFLADVGPLYARGSQGSFVSARMGVLYKLVPDTFEFIISGGGALAFAGEPWKSYSIANMLLNVHAGSAFFGAGAGFSKEVKETRKSDAELIANVGFDVFSNYTTMSMGSVFFEARGPVGKRRSFSDHHKLMLGFRYIF